MCRTFTILAIVMYAIVAAPASRAAAADAEAEPPVTPFIDSGNDLPDLDARARETAREASETRKARNAQLGPGRWYGWQLLAADLGTTVCIVGLQSGVCVMSYLGAGIGIHLAHGRQDLAGVSIGLRAGLAGIGGGIGLAIANCPERRSGGDWDFCGLRAVAVGMLVGAVIASAVDAAIAYERAAPEMPAAPVARRPRLIEPRLAVTHDGFSLGIGAAF